MSKEVRHFILESIDFGKFDVVEYKEYQKLEKEIERLNNIIERIKDVCISLEFSAPENHYIFIKRLREILEENK